MIERQTIGDTTATVMSYQIELLIAEIVHHLDEFVRHCAFAVRIVILGRGRHTTSAITAKINANDRPITCQLGGHISPHQARARKAMYHEQRGTLAISPGKNGIVGRLYLGWLKLIGSG